MVVVAGELGVPWVLVLWFYQSYRQQHTWGWHCWVTLITIEESGILDDWEYGESLFLELVPFNFHHWSTWKQRFAEAVQRHQSLENTTHVTQLVGLVGAQRCNLQLAAPSATAASGITMQEKVEQENVKMNFESFMNCIGLDLGDPGRLCHIVWVSSLHDFNAVHSYFHCIRVAFAHGKASVSSPLLTFSMLTLRISFDLGFDRTNRFISRARKIRALARILVGLLWDLLHHNWHH